MIPEIPKIPAVPNIPSIPSLPRVPKISIPPLPPGVEAALRKKFAESKLGGQTPPDITGKFAHLKQKLESKIEGVQKYKEKQELALVKKLRTKETEKFLQYQYKFDSIEGIAEDKLRDQLAQTKEATGNKITKAVKERK
jgi:hypothetical protein